MLSFRCRTGVPAVLFCALTLGCNGGATVDDTPQGGGAGSGSGGAGSGGMATTSAGSSNAGETQGGSASGSGGMGGGESSAGSGGASAGSAGSGSGGAGSCSKLGTQADVGTDGDGKKQIDGPYKPAPETQMHLNNAPAGKINDIAVGGQIPKPLIYAATKQYPGLNNMLKYEYWIYVPSQYKEGCPAALMVFQDGMHYVSTDSELHAPVVFDNLIASGDMPVTIGVFINPGEPGDGHYDGNEYQNRHVQYDKNDPSYVNFVVDEFLKDVVLPKYAIVDDPNGWAASGHSSGGIAAFMMGWHRPEKFRKLLTHDASFSNTGNYMNMSLLGAVDASPVKPLRIHLMSGPNDLGGWYGANTDAFTRLTAKQYHVQYITETSQHFPPQAAQQDFANALKWMWRGYKL